MKKFLIKLGIFSVVICATFIAFFLIIVYAIPSQFNLEYHSVINRKYDKLVKTEGPKLIYLSGSSGAFCVNNEKLSNGINLPVVNLGLHASYGIRFITEMSKANIDEGDIVVIAFEFTTYASKLDELSDIYVMTSGINDNMQLIQYFSNSEKEKLVYYFPTYVFQKIDRYRKHTIPKYYDIYSSNSFDLDGNLIYNRDESKIDENSISSFVIDEGYVNDEIIEYFKKYKQYIDSKGAQVVFNFSPLLNKTLISNKEQLENFKSYLEDKTGIKALNSIEDVLFESENLYDLNYHCNNKGQDIYTDMLINNINKYVKEI